MKKGINIWSFPAGMSVGTCIKMAKDAGYDGIELGLNENGELSMESSEKELMSIRKMAEEVNIELPSLATGLYWNYPFTSDDAVIRKKGLAVAKKQLETAAVLGADTVLIVPGAVGVDFISNTKVIPYDVAYDRSLEAFYELKESAEKLGVSIGIENVWNKFLLSPLEMRDFIDKIGSEYVGAYVDVGNIILTGYPEHWIRILGHRIKKVHVKDFRRSVGNINGFVDLLAGDVNYPEVTRALQEIGYNDYLTAEMGAYATFSDQIVYNTSKAMDRIIKNA